MARAALRHFVLGLAATGLLGGCVGSGGADGTAGTGATAGLVASPARGGTARDVEAPEIFQTTASALWDGRPSLGGIWVASPDVVDPERVVMFNPATGKSVNGALFRRERENPGPPLQLSSDAAEALGILAGQPTELRVTAIRRAEPEAAPEAAATDPAATDPAAEGAAPTDAAAETAALAAAALDATGTAVAGAAEGTAEAAAADGTAAADPVAEPPKRKTWKERRAEAKAKREAEKAARAAEKAAAEAAEAGAAPVEGAAEGAVTAGIDSGAIETAPLDARTPEAAPPAEAAPATAAAEPPPAATGAVRPIQIASFSRQENAQRAVDALAKIGITAQPQKSERAGKAVWGVVAMGDQALLARIKDAGFTDAYFLQ